MVEYVDVVLDGLQYGIVNEFIYDCLKISTEKVINSHFYQVDKGDFTFYDDLDFSKYLCDNKTCFIRLSTVFLGLDFYDIVLVFSADKNTVSISLTIPQIQFKPCVKGMLTEYLSDILLKYNLSSILVGLSDVSENDAYQKITKFSIETNEYYDIYTDAK